MRRLVAAALLLSALAAPAAAQDKKPPYWASIASGKAMTRTGPAKNYPGIWLYQRRDLPVRVLKKYDSWRLIEDPDGDQGWMLVTLLSDRRTALVKPGDPRPIRTEPSERRASATAPSPASSAGSSNAATAGAGSRSARERALSRPATSTACRLASSSIELQAVKNS